ncbi:hypothetical protein, partial [Streptomyces sp. NPDC056785]|uniref:hypothetical protein n=1 Tax=Streptomyces sp. NPDC056785 TaxID=3345944 RepID=UPI003673E135
MAQRMGLAESTGSSGDTAVWEQPLPWLGETESGAAGRTSEPPSGRTPEGAEAAPEAGEAVPEAAAARTPVSPGAV